MDVYIELDRVREAFDQRGIEALSGVDRVLLVVLELEAEVNNGGFSQFFFNSPGNLASEAPAAFDKIGAHKVAKLALEANALFGPGGPPIESEQRRDALDALDGDGTDVFGKLDESFYSYPDDIAGLLSTYLNQSR